MTNHTEILMRSIRLIEPGDYYKGYKELFSVLTHCDDLDESTFISIIQERSRQGWLTWVLEDTIEENNARTLKIVATLSLLLERKYYRNGRYVGHIEDVIVLPSHQHHKLGTALNTHAINYANTQGCYKVILDCKEDLEKFYSIAGMYKSNIQMAQYF